MSKSRKLLEDLSRETWGRIENSIAFDISQGEETITDNLLLNIKMSDTPSIIKITKCPKQLEAKKGVDWEWWIGSKIFGWIKYAVQAKKISLSVDLSEGKFEGLNHAIGKKPKNSLSGRTMQVDVLETYANSPDRVPLYVFYNYIKLSSPVWHHLYWHCKQKNYDERLLGCTISPLSVVKNSLEKPHRPSKRTFDKIHRHEQTLPWRCLLECPPIMELYLKNYIEIQDSPNPPTPNGRSANFNVFDSGLFGKVSVYNTQCDDLVVEGSKLMDSEGGAKRLVIIDIEEEIVEYAQSEVGKRLLTAAGLSYGHWCY